MNFFFNNKNNFFLSQKTSFNKLGTLLLPFLLLTILKVSSFLVENKRPLGPFASSNPIVLTFSYTSILFLFFFHGQDQQSYENNFVGLGFNLRTYFNMYSFHHTKIMEKCFQDQVLYTSRHNESDLRFKSFQQFGLGL